MFICLDCGHISEGVENYREDHDFAESYHEHIEGCPICGGMCVETTRCEWCGEYITGKYVELADGTVLCSDCYKEKDIADIL